MPVYEYYCPTCAIKFEKLQRTQAAGDSALCPAGHPNAARTLSMFATFRRGADGEMEAVGGGCACGGACACGDMSRN